MESVQSATVPSLAFATLLSIIAIIVGPMLSKKLPTVDRLVVTWLLYDALVHFILVSLRTYDTMILYRMRPSSSK